MESATTVITTKLDDILHCLKKDKKVERKPSGLQYLGGYVITYKIYNSEEYYKARARLLIGKTSNYDL